MKVIFKDYSRPSSDDTCLAMCFFRPVEYKNPIRNLGIFLGDMRRAGIPIFSIELLYGGQASTLMDADVVVKSESVLFSKENLWNILERSIPEKYSKIVFLDCDVRFGDPDWFNKCSEILDRHDVLQPLEHCYRDIYDDLREYEIEESEIRPAIAKGISEGSPINIAVHYPGFGIGIRREFFHSIGGFCDYGLGGYGDSLFWGAFDDFNSKCLEFTLKRLPQYLEYRNTVANARRPESVSYLRDNICMHLYHGTMKNRQYGKTNLYVPEEYELFYNEYGVLEIKSDHDLIQYWLDRREDD